MGNNLYTTVAEADARLVGERGDVLVAGDILTREWPFVDATYADGLMATLLLTKTVTSPLADSQTFTGTFAVSDVFSTASEDRSVTITQKLTLIDEGGNLGTPIQMARVKIEEVFGLQEGTTNDVAYQYLYLHPEERTTYDSVTVSVPSDPSGLAEKDRRWVVEGMGDRTASLFVLFRKIVWPAWGHDGSAADLTEYGNAGTANEKETITKTWENIANGDMATAISDIRLGTTTAAESGYIIVDTGIRDNHNGSLNIFQVQRKQVNDVDEAPTASNDTFYVDPLGLEPGQIDEIRTIYDDFTKVGLTTAVAAESAPATYTTLGPRTSMKGNGLYRRVYTYRKATWPNTVTTGTPAREEQTAAYGGDSEKKIGAHRAESYYGLAIADAESVVQQLKDNTDDTTQAVDWIRYNLGPQGSATVTRFRSEFNTDILTTDALIQEIRAVVGSQQAAYVRFWPALSPTDADTLVASGGVARSDFTADAVVYSHSTVRRKTDSAGRVDVIQVGVVPEINFSGSGNWSGFDRDDEWKQTFVTDVDGVLYRYTIGKKLSSQTVADSYANGGSPVVAAIYLNSPILEAGGASRKGGEVKRIENLTTKYLATREIWEVTSSITGSDEFGTLGDLSGA